MQSTEDISIMIGTPVIGNPTRKMAASLFSLIKPTKCSWIQLPDRPCDVARNLLVERCLEDGWDWLWMLDADMCFEPETLIALNARAKPLIAALCFTRVMPPAPACYRGKVTTDDEGYPRYKVQAKEIIEFLERNMVRLDIHHPAVILPDQVDALKRYDSTGGACVLIHRDVLEAIEPPWFKYTHPDRMVGEDFYFFQKARAAGYDLWIDRTVIVGHAFGEQYIGPEDYVAHIYGAQYYGLPEWLKLMGRLMRRFGLG